MIYQTFKTDDGSIHKTYEEIEQVYFTEYRDHEYNLHRIGGPAVRNGGYMGSYTAKTGQLSRTKRTNTGGPTGR